MSVPLEARAELEELDSIHRRIAEEAFRQIARLHGIRSEEFKSPVLMMVRGRFDLSAIRGEGEPDVRVSTISGKPVPKHTRRIRFPSKRGSAHDVIVFLKTAGWCGGKSAPQLWRVYAYSVGDSEKTNGESLVTPGGFRPQEVDQGPSILLGILRLFLRCRGTETTQ